jgi:hypothetical protein
MSTPTTPSTEQLWEVQRDLRFHPSTTENLEVPTREPAATSNQQGYLAGGHIFDEEESAPATSDELLAGTIAAGARAHLKYGHVLTHAQSSAGSRPAGKGVIAWRSHFVSKVPGDGKRVPWHQDPSYWPLTPSMGELPGLRSMMRASKTHA